MSNPTFASWNYDGRNGSELAPNIARFLDRGWCVNARDEGPVLVETVRTAGQARRMVECSAPTTDTRGRDCSDLAAIAARLFLERG